MFFPALTRRPPASVRLLSAALLTVGGLALVPSSANAQTPGTLDTTFTSAEVGATFYALTLEEVSDVQYLFLGGDAGLAQREVAATGVVDKTFTLGDFGLPTQRIIYTAVPELITVFGQPSPKILVGGLFGRDAAQVLANEPGQSIKRILPGDGDLDPTFDPGSGANNFVTSILPLADGSMVVGGEFDQFNQIDHERIVKLDNNGAIVDDSVFSSSLGFDATVLSLAPQYAADGSGQNGQILVGGIFSNVNGQTHTKLARINADGSVDASFNPVFSDRVVIVVSEPDGKILAGGDFETVNGQTEKHLVRLNYDGSVDTTFSAQVTNMPPLIAAPVAVNTITPFGDGRYYIGGNFAKINGVARAYLGAVLNDGTVDTFDPGKTLSNAVEQVLIDKVANTVYVSQMRDKSVNAIFPASVFRLFGDYGSGPKVNVTSFQATSTYLNKTSPGGFTFTRTTAETAQPITVYFTIGGTGTYTLQGKKGDFHVLPFPEPANAVGGATTYSFLLPAKILSVDIHVTQTKSTRAGRTATLTLLPDEGNTDAYMVGENASATVTLVAPPGS